jgi:hypothetical protein
MHRFHNFLCTRGGFQQLSGRSELLCRADLEPWTKIIGLAKDPHPPVPAIENVIDHSTFDGSTSSQHDGMITPFRERVTGSDASF